MKQIFLSILFLFLILSSGRGQLFESDVYNVNPWIDGAITLGAFGMNTWELAIADSKPPLDSTEISQLDANDINAFDRSATWQDASKMYQSWDMSDIGMNGSFFLPLLLVLDKDTRQDWAPLILLYLQAEGRV